MDKDFELIAQITNNHIKFGLLYDRHTKLVYNLCLSIVKNKLDV